MGLERTTRQENHRCDLSGASRAVPSHVSILATHRSFNLARYCTTRTTRRARSPGHWCALHTYSTSVLFDRVFVHDALGKFTDWSASGERAAG